MYEEYFGLKRSPFRITPDTSLFYDGGQRGDILGALVYAVHRGEGIIKVVGEVGSGKTMLCRMLQLELPENVEIIYIANPSVSPEDILYVIAAELKFDLSKDASKHEVHTLLQNYLLRKHAEDKQVVLFIEEAQGMPLETLEEIRLLSNLETDQHKLLQIILFGQPELDQNLENNSIRQLRERITHDFQLSPLSPKQIHTYLNFRLREVGYTGPELVNEKLASKMAVYSKGLLRRINILADKMLLSAFADSTHTLTNKHLLDAVNDSGFSSVSSSPGTGPKWRLTITVMGLIVVAALAYALYLVNQGAFLKAFPAARSIMKPSVMDQPVAITENTAVEDKTGSSDVEPLVSKTLVEEPISKLDLVAQKIKLDNEEKERIKRVLDTVTDQEVVGTSAEMEAGSKKNQQTDAKLDKVVVNQSVEPRISSKKLDAHEQWLKTKIASSKQWLRQADKQGVSIQVMMRSKSAAKELAIYLQTEWPLDLDKTYLYEVNMKDRQIYRVFYNEYPTITLGQMKMKQLPESVRINSPYLHSIYRMQKALL
ncbi:MAG: AAA family ATPase [Gammaproteobacteria bacterium]|nr:AAA family ATPase [Gammaproteobacteria bacterium]